YRSIACESIRRRCNEARSAAQRVDLACPQWRAPTVALGTCRIQCEASNGSKPCRALTLGRLLLGLHRQGCFEGARLSLLNAANRVLGMLADQRALRVLRYVKAPGDAPADRGGPGVQKSISQFRIRI